MNWLKTRFPLMAEAGAEGGGAEGGNTPSSGGDPVGREESAFATKNTPTDTPTDATTDTPTDAPTDAPDETGTDKTQTVESAFAAKNAPDETGADKPQTADDGLTMTREALGGMSDSDWVSATLEGVEGVEKDDPILTGIAQTCREVGVSPKQMNRIQSKFTEVLNERIGKLQAEKDAAEREAAQKATKESLAAFDDSEWADIRAAGREYIPEGSELSRLMQGSLGSNKEMLTILKTLGESLRGDAPSSTGARGSGLSLEERLFQKTVPAGLR